MQKLIILLLLVNSLHAKKIIQLYNTVTKKVESTMSFQQLQALVRTSEKHLEIEKIEANNQVKIVSKSKFILIRDMEDDIIFNIKWFSKDKVLDNKTGEYRIRVVKDITVKGKLNFKKEAGIGKLRTAYRDTAEVATPILSIVVIILIFLL